jgi:hypothetical protein
MMSRRRFHGRYVGGGWNPYLMALILALISLWFEYLALSCEFLRGGMNFGRTVGGRRGLLYSSIATIYRRLSYIYSRLRCSVGLVCRLTPSVGLYHVGS